MKQGRGQLTERIKQRSKKLLGYEIDTTELRLMPYIQYVMTNEQKIKIQHINHEERKIFQKWKKLGYMEGGITELKITKEFWNIINEIIFLGYVDLNDN